MFIYTITDLCKGPTELSISEGQQNSMLFLPMGKPRKGVFQDHVLEVGQSKRNQLITELGSILNIGGPILFSTYTFQFN